MRLVAYLCSSDTISTSTFRRWDAFEHDSAYQALSEAFESIGRTLVEVVWDTKDVDWSTYEAALIGSTWDYTQNRAQYLSALRKIAHQCRLFNSIDAVVWNTIKYYLRDLEDHGILISPTIWPDQLNVSSANELFERLQTDVLLAKPIVGACSEGHLVFSRGNAPSITVIQNAGLMVQPFYPEIAQAGEVSLAFFGKTFSHAVLKTPADGDYRVQSIFGGKESIFSPGPEHLSVAEGVIEALPYDTLYARVDLFRLSDGQLALMELEITEPYLYLQLSADACVKLTDEYIKRIR